MAVGARRIDPRDQSWEIGRPPYRVYFWQPQGTADDAMWTSDEWELTDADDVAEVMSWAESNSGGRRLVVYVRVMTQDGAGLVRLLGCDPSAQPAEH